MEGMSAIIAAMMGMQPQVTPMGAAPRGGSGRVSGGSQQGGGGSGGGVSRARPMPAMAQDDLMNLAPLGQITPQGVDSQEFTGTPQMSPNDAGVTNSATERGQAPDADRVMKQVIDAESEVRRLKRDTNTEAGRQRARQHLPEAEERLQWATKVYQEHQLVVEAQARQKDAERIRGQMLQMSADPQTAEQYYKMALADKSGEVVNQIDQQFMETTEAMRAEGAAAVREDDKEDWDSAEMFNALTNAFGLPEYAASAMAQTDSSMKENVELWRKVQEEGTLEERNSFKQELAKAGAYNTVDNTIKQINNTLGHADNFGSTGLASVFYSKIPGTEAYATLKSVDTQRAVNAFLELMNMRKASETGGALGNVSNREIELLYNAYTALDPSMGDAFQRNMVDVLQRFERVKFMLANEARFEREGATAEQMFNASTRHVNTQVAAKMRGSMKTPVDAINFLMDNPETSDQFQQRYGWSPISYEMDADLSGLVGGHDSLR